MKLVKKYAEFRDGFFNVLLTPKAVEKAFLMPRSNELPVKTIHALDDFRVWFVTVGNFILSKIIYLMVVLFVISAPFLILAMLLVLL
ncbi:MAG: hypothetical protein ACYC3O_07260 [Burkholderiales bacterium]